MNLKSKPSVSLSFSILRAEIEKANHTLTTFILWMTASGPTVAVQLVRQAILWERSPRRPGVAVAAIATLLGCLVPSAYLHAQILQAKYHFRLLQGQGTPVCGALLKRLQVTKFQAPPYCGIPENDSVSGFAYLHRVPLTESEIVELFPKVFSFTFKQNQYAVPRQSRAAEIKNYIQGGTVRVWRYVPEISVENDGKPDNVAVWQGAGIYPGESSSFQCGETWRVNDPPDGVRTTQMALVLTSGDRAIDQKRTKQLFGNPGKAKPYILAYQRMGGGLAPFGPLGGEMGFLEYKGTYYIYAFDGAVLTDRHADLAAKDMPNSLMVYVRKPSTVRQVCRYRMRVSLPAQPGEEQK